MSQSARERRPARCACGSVELEASGAPILGVVCYCGDCQEGARRIEGLPGAPRIRDPDGGSEYLLYRKDRVITATGAEHLRDHRLEDGSQTRRVAASCCNSAMFLDFERGHWFSVYRARFAGDVPPLQMRVQTKSRTRSTIDPGDVPSYAGFPPRFLFKLVAARIAMSFTR